MTASRPRRAPRLPTWFRALLAGYGLLVMSEVAAASNGAQVASALVTALALGPLGVVVIIASVNLWLYDQTVLMIRGVTTTAVVEGFSRPNPGSDMRYPTYRYRPRDSDELINTSSIGIIFQRATGAEVLIRYDPKRPELVAGAHFSILRTLTGLFLFALGTTMAVSVIVAAVSIL